MPAGTPLAQGELIEFGENRLDLAASTLESAGSAVVITVGEFGPRPSKRYR